MSQDREGKPLTYAAAGVDIDAGNALVEAIKPLAKATAIAGTEASLGGFGAFFDPRRAGFKDPILVATTDGVGTKLKIAIDTGIFDTIGIDLVAMCVNDLIVQGARPLFFLDYFAIGHLDLAMGRAIIAGIAAGCREAGCALIGGETAEMPGLYRKGDFDLAGFAVGAVERGEAITGAGIAAGDIVLGLASSGPHSNGYSLIRKIVERSGLELGAEAPFAPGESLGAALLRPTRIYVQSLLGAINRGSVKGGGVKGLAHITGGGLLENIPRILPAGLACAIDAKAWELPPIFAWLKKIAAIDALEMARVFNCGIGMVLIAAEKDAAALTAHLEAEGERVFRLGRIEDRGQGEGCRIAGAESWS